MNISQRIYLIVGVLLALFIGGLVLTVHITTALSDRGLAALERQYQELAEARQLQLEHKKQVQEWKNILVRAQNPKDLATHTQKYHDREAELRRHAESLQQSTRDPWLAERLRTFLRDHAAMGQSYAHARAVLLQGPERLREADQLSRGVDWPVVALLDQVAERTAAQVAQVKQELAAAQARWLRAVLLAAGVIFALALLACNLQVRVIRRRLEQAVALVDGLGQVEGDLSRTAQLLGQSNAEQSQSVAQTATSVEEISAAVREGAAHARQTDEIAVRLATDASTGGVALEQTVSAMRDIAQRTTLIDELAQQSDLLALNAGIEAARAGDMGRGFGVVADEVAHLAARSQEAARQIGAEAERSVRQAEHTGAILRDILDGIRRTSALMGELSSGVQAQAAAVEQVSVAMAQLTQVEQRGSEAAHQLEETSGRMSHQVDQLRRAIDFLRA